MRPTREVRSTVMFGSRSTLTRRNRVAVASPVVVAAVVAALFAAGCGSADRSAPTVTTNPSSPPAPTTGEPRSSTADGPDGSSGVELVRVIDGDTFTVSIAGSISEVRLIGINAPESGECWSGPATEALTNLLGTGPLRLERDISDTDQYGRLLRYAWIGDVFVNEAMVVDGHAIARRYEPDTARAERLEAAQAPAQAQARGLWAADACGEADPARLEFGEIVADPPGDDLLDLNGEWVTLTNVGPERADLGGWTVRDESSSHRYVFAPGTTVEPGASIVLRSGCGTNRADEVFWCQKGSAIWNNGGDTAFLLDPSGNVAASQSFGRPGA